MRIQPNIAAEEKKAATAPMHVKTRASKFQIQAILCPYGLKFDHRIF